MSLSQKIKEDFLVAFKNKQATEVSVLRLLKAALTNKEIEKKIAKGSDLSDSEALAVIKAEVKKRQDSIEAYSQAGRTDLADKERAELEFLAKYLPAKMSEEKIREIAVSVISEVGAIGPADFGKVMASVMGRLAGAGDGQIVKRLVTEELTKK